MGTSSSKQSREWDQGQQGRGTYTQQLEVQRSGPGRHEYHREVMTQHKQRPLKRAKGEVEILATPEERFEYHPRNVVEVRPDEYQASQYEDYDQGREHRELYEQQSQYDSGQSQEIEHERDQGGYTERHVSQEMIANPNYYGNKVQQTRVVERQARLIGGGAARGAAPHRKIQEVRREFEQIRSDRERERADLLRRLQALENEERNARSTIQQYDQEFGQRRRPIQERLSQLEQEHMRERQRLQETDTDFIRRRREIEQQLHSVEAAEQAERRKLQEKESELGQLEARLKERERVLVDLYRQQQEEIERKQREVAEAEARAAEMQRQQRQTVEEEFRRRAQAQQLQSQAEQQRAAVEQAERQRQALAQQRQKLEQAEQQLRGLTEAEAQRLQEVDKAAVREREHTEELRRQREQLENERIQYQKQLDVKRKELEQRAAEIKPEQQQQLQQVVEKETIIRAGVAPVTPTSARTRDRAGSATQEREGVQSSTVKEVTTSRTERASSERMPTRFGSTTATPASPQVQSKATTGSRESSNYRQLDLESAMT